MRIPRALLLYVEPTPYIEGLIKEIQRVWSGDLEVCYIAKDRSQDWKIDAKRSGRTILPINCWRAIVQLWRSLGRLSRGDVVHLAGFGHPLLIGALLMGKLRGLRVFIEIDTSTGQAGGGWKKIVKRVIYPPLFRMADHFLPGGKRQAAYLASYGVPHTKTTTAQMTVDVASITRYVATAGDAARGALRARLGYTDDIGAVLYLGRLEPSKGVADLLDAFADIASRRGDVRLMVAGSGSLDSLVRDAAAVDPRISYLGRLSGTAVLDAYLASDIVVVPSRFEPWGLVVNEAMACGRPIVGTDRIGCVDDLVTLGRPASLFQRKRHTHSPMRLSCWPRTIACAKKWEPRQRAGSRRGRCRTKLRSWSIAGTRDAFPERTRSPISARACRVCRTCGALP